MAYTLVQSKAAGSVTTGTNPSATFDAAPTAGNLLIAYAAEQGSATAIAVNTTGWTRLSTSAAGGTGGNTRAGGMFYKVAGASEGATHTFTSVGNRWVLFLSEWSGNTATPAMTDLAELEVAAATFTTTAVTPTSAREALVVSGFGIGITGATWSAEAVSGSNVGTVNELGDISASVGAPSGAFAYATVSSTSGSYTASANPSNTATAGESAIAFFEAAAAAPAAVPYRQDRQLVAWRGF